ncbi:MAG: tRNA(Ile)(2)-agmatinylcytidine synthase [Candidatus Thermoplasmatota archaeon]|nr:tRNA(Ile)(2)-agmatinylcytidine synthase [Candidatus Thermoplasmatota archaeon]
MPILGIDDTDSRTEMCTTYLTIEILKNSNLDLIGFPRLVRLNPNIPLKTRGNAAISLTLGRGEGKKEVVGRIGEESINSFKRYREERMDIDIMSIIEKFSPKEKDTNPALVIGREKNDENFYWDAVREFVDYAKVVDKVKGDFWSIEILKNSNGANAAISWPERNPTYELIAYLEREMWSGSHFVDDSSSKLIERTFVDTFDNFDFKNNYNAIRPTTKTPVLFGIRSIEPTRLIDYERYIKSEPFSSFVIYKTNQATDDHLVERTIEESKLYSSSIIRGFVSSEPSWSRGGILSFDIESNGKKIRVVAMEPTKEFRTLLSKLTRGDEVRVYGGITKVGFINIEKIEVISVSRIKEIRPPLCPKCKTRMESVGRSGGFRCRKCGARSNKGEERTENREIAPGFYEVPIIARRHLARPLKLGIVK